MSKLTEALAESSSLLVAMLYETRSREEIMKQIADNRTALDAAPPEVEPVAWVERHGNWTCINFTSPEAERKCPTQAKLYLNPPFPKAPEVEPVAWLTPGGDVTRSKLYAEQQSILSEESPVPLFTSPPSPKAEWDAEGNPLNLEAAARDMDIYYHPTMSPILIENLRKFLKDES